MNTMWLGKTESTPLGSIWVVVSAKGLVAVSIKDEQHCLQIAQKYGVTPSFDANKTKLYTAQIAAYLNKKRTSFDMPIAWSVMSLFQQQALQQVMKVPHGQTKSYGEIARAIGKPKASRAIGRANATNPMPLIIPCHRVLSADGSLRGYSAAGGLKTKQWLLDLEK